MDNEIIQFIRGFALKCHRIFYSITALSTDKRQSKISFVREEFAREVCKFTSDSQYEFIIDGLNLMADSICSVSIIVIDKYSRDLAIYDVFGDVLYTVKNSIVYFNNRMVAKSITPKYTGNMICDGLRFIQYLTGHIANPATFIPALQEHLVYNKL